MKKLYTRATILQELSNAKFEHENWIEKVIRCVNKYYHDEDSHAMLTLNNILIKRSSINYPYYQWIMSYSAHLPSLSEIKSYVSTIDILQSQIHVQYTNIRNLLCVTSQNRSLMHMVMTMNSKKLSNQEKENLKSYIDKLNLLSNQLIKVSMQLEDKIKDTESIYLRERISA